MILEVKGFRFRNPYILPFNTIFFWCYSRTGVFSLIYIAMNNCVEYIEVRATKTEVYTMAKRKTEEKGAVLAAALLSENPLESLNMVPIPDDPDIDTPSFRRIDSTRSVSDFLRNRKQFCDRMVSLFADGLSIVEVCLELGMPYRTFKKLIGTYSDFRDAAEEGMMRLYAYWQQEGRNNLRDNRFNSSLWMNFMINQFGWEKNAKSSGEGQDVRIMSAISDRLEEQAAQERIETSGEDVDVKAQEEKKAQQIQELLLQVTQNAGKRKESIDTSAE